ncbi:putative Polycomb group protein ASXL2 [Oscarella lobularis]|uniref:putative Polycomb group protein ASXL2 n=1 Tax=Oscarella lobularis TaxID=121494 RepID=UPI0033140CCF
MPEIGPKKAKSKRSDAEKKKPLVVRVDLRKLERIPVSGKRQKRKRLKIGEVAEKPKSKHVTKSKPTRPLAKPVRPDKSSSPSLPSSKVVRKSVFKFDLFSCDSIMSFVDLKKIICKENFDLLTVSDRKKLMEMLPKVDQSNDPQSMSDDAFTNSHFNAALNVWQDRLQAGELTSSMRRERDLENALAAKSEPEWKVKFYEDVYGERALDSLLPIGKDRY